MPRLNRGMSGWAGGAMGKVETFSVTGLDIFILSQDHRPPHIHVRRPSEWEIRIYFMDCTETHLEFEVKWSKRSRNITRAQRAMMLQLVYSNRESLLTEWESKVCKD